MSSGKFTRSKRVGQRASAGTASAGVSFGGYAQYRAPDVLVLRVDALGNPIPAQLLGDSGFTTGVHLRYERKLWGRTRWSVQLNVFNLLDTAPLLRKSVDPVTGTTTAWGYRQPRAFRLTNTVSF